MNIVNLRDKMLLLHSNVIQDYPWLQELLDANKTISDKIVDDLSTSQQKFFQYLYPSVLKQAGQEWAADLNQKNSMQDLGEASRLPCSLCHQPTRYVCYINNRLTGVSLNVGSECIKHFGIDMGKPVQELIKEAKRVKKLENLNEAIPGIAQLLDNWNRVIDEQPVILPLNLENSYLELGRKARNIYEDYLDEKVGNEIITGLKQILDKQEAYVANIGDHVKSSRDKPFAAPKRIEKWLSDTKSESARDILLWIKEDGEITWRTAHRIDEPDFMKSLIPGFNRFFDKIDAMITNIDTQRLGYIYHFKGIEKVKLFLKHRDFVLNYGGLLFGLEPVEVFAKEKIIGYSSINDQNSFEFQIGQFTEILRRANVRIHDYDMDMDELVIWERSSNKFALTGIREFCNEFRFLSLNMENQSARDVEGYIKNLSNKRYTKEELKDFRSIRENFYKRS